MTHHERIAEMSRAIRAWCIARTPTIQDAEDLPQDVLLAMLEAAPNLRDEGAFYGFMWGVAGNVYRQWAKRKARRKECELTEAVCEPVFPEDAPEDVALLRRELTLLSRRYREMAGINQDVRFIGMDDTIEVWAREKAEEPFMLPEEFGNELVRLMEIEEKSTL